MQDLFRYDGKRVLVVGCATGMGAAAAKAVQLLGGEVHGVDYREADFELAGFHHCDLRDEAAVTAMIDSLGGPFHGLFIAAGLPTTFAMLDIMRVNIMAVRKVVEGVQPLMPRGSAIGIIASTGGLRFMDRMDAIKEFLALDGSYASGEAWCESHRDRVAEGYGFSKECAIVFTMQHALAAVADGIRVNCISPGATDTPMMLEFEKTSPPGMIKAFYGPMGRMATPEEMGWPLVFLNSDAASFITGVNLLVDAGFVAGMMTGLIDLNALMASAQQSLAD